MAATPDTAATDVGAALLDIEAGIYAIAAIADGDWNGLVGADRARNGIQYLAAKLERDVRTLYRQIDATEPAAAAGGAV